MINTHASARTAQHTQLVHSDLYCSIRQTAEELRLISSLISETEGMDAADAGTLSNLLRLKAAALFEAIDLLQILGGSFGPESLSNLDSPEPQKIIRTTEENIDSFLSDFIFGLKVILSYGSEIMEQADDPAATKAMIREIVKSTLDPLFKLQQRAALILEEVSR